MWYHLWVIMFMWYWTIHEHPWGMSYVKYSNSWNHISLRAQFYCEIVQFMNWLPRRSVCLCAVIQFGESYFTSCFHVLLMNVVSHRGHYLYVILCNSWTSWGQVLCEIWQFMKSLFISSSSCLWNCAIHLLASTKFNMFMFSYPIRGITFYFLFIGFVQPCYLWMWYHLGVIMFMWHCAIANVNEILRAYLMWNCTIHELLFGIGIYLGCFLTGSNSAHNTIIINKWRYSDQKIAYPNKYTPEVTIKVLILKQCFYWRWIGKDETQSNIRYAIFRLKKNKKMRNSAKYRFLVMCGRLHAQAYWEIVQFVNVVSHQSYFVYMTLYF